MFFRWYERLKPQMHLDFFTDNLKDGALSCIGFGEIDPVGEGGTPYITLPIK